MVFLMPFKSVIFADTMSVSRVLLMFMSLCIGVASCVKDPDASLHSAPEIIDTTVSLDGTNLDLRCKVSRADNIKGCGFYFGNSENDMERLEVESISGNEFSTMIPGLACGEYYCRSFVSSGGDDRLSEVQRIEIEQRMPVLSINSLTIRNGTALVFDYSVEDVFSGEMVICGLCWSLSPSPTLDLTTKTMDGSDYGERTVSVEGLTIGQTYYFRAYAVNAKGTAYSQEMEVVIPMPFEDKTLADWMLANWDKDSDGLISYEEAALVTKIDIISDDVKSLKGLEYLPNLDTVRCRGLSCGPEGGSGTLASIDIGANDHVTCLDLSNNHIESLTLSGASRLTSLVLSGNVELKTEALTYSLASLRDLRSIDITGCRNLTPDLSLFPSLEEFRYDSRSGIKDNEKLFRQKSDLRRLYAGDALKDGDKIYLLSDLEVLDCGGSPVHSLNLRYNAKLRSLNLDGCDEISCLDLNTNPELSELHCMCKGLSRLELLEGHEIDGINVNLGQHRYIPESVEIVYTPRVEDKVFKRFILDHYDFNYDSFVSLAEAAEVESMNIPAEEYSRIVSLYGLGMFTALRSLDVSGQTLLTEINLSKNVALAVLVCDNTSLKALDLSDCPALVSLYAQNTSLDSLDLSRNPALKEAYLSSSPIKTLYLTAAQKANLDLVCDPGTEIIVVE
jgi:Leucine-rich repeat (LRR) protein